jgi:hypothetical protein
MSAIQQIEAAHAHSPHDGSGPSSDFSFNFLHRRREYYPDYAAASGHSLKALIGRSQML